MAKPQDSDYDDETKAFKKELTDELHEKFASCNTSNDGVLNEEQFRKFQAAMDAQAVNKGMRHRDTSGGERFDKYWTAFNSLTKEDGVTEQEIIFIRSYCGMFGADIQEDFMANLV